VVRDLSWRGIALFRVTDKAVIEALADGRCGRVAEREREDIERFTNWPGGAQDETFRRRFNERYPALRTLEIYTPPMALSPQRQKPAK